MNTEPTKRISGATLTVPKKSPAAGENLYERLKRLNGNLGMNKNDAVTALIVACIDEGLNTDQLIIPMIVRLGYDNRHVGAILTRGGFGRWRRNADKTYSPLT